MMIYDREMAEGGFLLHFFQSHRLWGWKLLLEFDQFVLFANLFLSFIQLLHYL